ncbi:MAG: hypothetical protein ABIO92_00595 [Chloroflexia bacterium]
MLSSRTKSQRPGCLRYVATSLAIVILTLIVALWWVPNLVQSAASISFIASNIGTLRVDSAGVCGEWHVKPSPSSGFLKDDVNVASMDALSSSDIWIVGEVYGPRDWDDKQSHDFLAVHLDGSTSQAYSLKTLVGSSFATVTMISPTDVWASGPHTSLGSSPQLAHWEGSDWSVVPVELPSSSASLMSTASTYFNFTALPNGELWVGGTVYPSSASSDSKPYNILMHRDDSSWQQVPIPEVLGIGEILAISANDIWVDGLDAMLHWNGQEWARVARPDGRIRDMTASAADDVWAVGDESSEHEGSSNIVIMHWDGRTWSQVPVPTIPVPTDFLTAFRFELKGVTAISKEDVWAVGYLEGDTTESYRQQEGNTTDFYRRQAITLHWDGKTWRLLPSPNFSVSQSFSDIVAVSPNELWAAGQVGPDIDERQILVTQFVKQPCNDPPSSNGSR